MSSVKSKTRYLLLASLLTVLGSLQSAAQEKVRIALPTSNYGPFVPIHVAQDLGYYKKNGVEVEMTSYRGGAAAQEGLVIGQADMVILSPGAVALGVKKGVKQKIVGVLATSASGWHIMVLKDSPIKTIKDLDGKDVAITAAGSLTELYLAWAAKEAGITVRRTPVGNAGLVPSLKGKLVDAASMSPPMPDSLMLTGEGRSIFDIGKDLPPAIPDVWVATQALIDKNPKAIEAVMRSVYQAVAYMKKNRERSLAFLRTYTGETNEQVIQITQDVVLNAMPTSAKIDRKWLDVAIEMAKLGGATDLPPNEQIYTDAFASVSDQ
jgi:NitT/TauT family transport system substrate-binding protein